MQTRRTFEMWELDDLVSKIKQVPLNERYEVLFLWTKDNKVSAKQFETLIKYCI
jgi:hypothetical protein